MQVKYVAKCNKCGSYLQNGVCKCGNLACSIQHNVIRVYCNTDDFEIYNLYVDKDNVVKKQFKIFDKVMKKLRNILDKL